MQSSERAWVHRVAFLVMALTTLPYLLGVAVQGKDWRFTGFVFGVEDGNSYIAKMLRGAAGAWLFHTPYTTFPQNGIFAFFPYLLLGKLAQPPGMHEQLMALYHLFRFGAGILAILATYDFLALFLSEIRWRRLGLILCTLGGGLGWILVIFGRSEWLGSLPLEFYSPETFGFLSLFGLPHLALVRALLLWGFVFYLTRRKPGLLAGGIWLLLGLVQPLYVVVAWAILGTYLLIAGLRQAWKHRQNPGSGLRDWFGLVKEACLALAISSPPVIYTLIASIREPFFQAWTRQNLILSPHPFHYLLAYGLIILLILICLPRLSPQRYWDQNRSGFLLIAAWVIILPILIYAPYNLQRRLAEGAWVALITLALVVIENRPPRWMSYSLFLLIPSTILLWVGGMLSASRPALPLFRPSAEIAAFEFLAHEASPGTVVMAAYETANALPAWATVQVIIGHGPESPGFSELKPRIDQFYSLSTSETERLSLLQEFGVRYLFWGPAERALGDWDPHTASYLEPIYDAKGYAVFIVHPFTYSHSKKPDA
jgi:hypothetical protein